MNSAEFHQKIQAVTSPLPGEVPYTYIRKFSVKGKFDNYSLIDFLTSFLPHLPKQDWLNDLEAGRMTIDGVVPSPNRVVRAGTRIINQVPNCVDPIINPNIELLYDDSEIMVFNKPAPLPMHACGRFNRNNLLTILEMAFPKIDFKIVHRLDADTTGIVIMAKNAKNATHICKQFKDHTTTKTYLALVHRLVKEDEFSCFDAIGKETIAGGARALTCEGLKSETHCTVLERFDNKTLLQVEPKSGRTNQIRIHLAERGHPIIGDQCYSKNKNKDVPLTLSKNELCLHAWKLSFVHPTTGSKQIFQAEVPSIFNTKSTGVVQ